MDQAIVWEKAHSQIEWSSNPSLEFLAFMAEHYWGESDKKFLDLGCGTGANSLFLAKKGFDVTAVDISKTACDKLNSNKEFTSLIKIINSNIFDLNFEEKSIDCVIMGNLIDCLDLLQSIELLKLIRKWLKSDGRIFAKIQAEEIPDIFKRCGIITRSYTVDELRLIFSNFIGSMKQVINYTLMYEQLPITTWILDLTIGI